ncbi:MULTISPECIES: methylamine utilization protein [Marinomonas]|uniref:Plastocyanin n=1 Tax=Marinomonas alcarazii TaxID=491949 RepID=A0A318V691_9GAMM|nr:MULTISPECIES: methylamine utilization protein [Marinomonas]PYF83187.1 plastocyanin [Marinomonas alcarazii]
MRYLIALMFFLSLSNARAEITLTVLDQDNLPVDDAVITVPQQFIGTPNKVAVMDQVNESFVPRVLVVQKGQYVSFPNSDDIRHHVYSFSQPKSFEIKLYKGTAIEPILFDKPGLVVLGCNIHDDMIGYIIVADNALVFKTDENGQVTLPVKKGDKISLWTERTLQGIDVAVPITITGEAEQSITMELLPPPIEMMDHGSMTKGFGKPKWSN